MFKLIQLHLVLLSLLLKKFAHLVLLIYHLAYETFLILNRSLQCPDFHLLRVQYPFKLLVLLHYPF